MASPKSELGIEIDNLMTKGKFYEALELIDDSDNLDILMKKAVIFEKIGKYQKSLELAKNIFDQIDVNTDAFLYFKSLVTISYAYWRLGEFEEVRDTLNKTLNEINKLNRENKSKEIYQLEAECYYVSGIIYDHHNELQKSLGDFQRALEIRNEYGTKGQISHSLNSLGIAYDIQGRYDKALEFYNKSLQLKREIGNKQDIARTLFNIASIYDDRGDAETALDYYDDCILYFNEFGSPNDVAIVYSSMGHLQMSQGKVDVAHDYFQKSLELNSNASNYEIINNLEDFVSYYLKIDDLEKATEYLNKIKNLAQEEDNKKINQEILQLEASIMKQRNRASAKVKALELFREVLKNGELRSSFKINSFISIIELYLDEFQRYNNQEIIDEIFIELENLEEFAEKENSPKLEIQVMNFKARIELLTGNIRDAKELMDRAIEVAELNGYSFLKEMVVSDYQKYFDQMNDFSLISSNLTIEEKIEYLEFDTLFSNMIYDDITKSEKHEKPLLLIIIEEGGTIKYSYKFEDMSINPHLFGSFISAMNSFSSELVDQGSGKLEHIKHNQYSILMERIGKLMSAYVFDGYTLDAMKNFQSFIDRLQNDENVWSELNKQSYAHNKKLEKMVNSITEEIFGS